MSTGGAAIDVPIESDEAKENSGALMTPDTAARECAGRRVILRGVRTSLADGRSQRQIIHHICTALPPLPDPPD